MAKYDKDTKFYWLQLKEDFFEDDAIEWLEEQKPNGRDYAYFYLKLCLKSLKSNGILVRNVGNILIPYDNRKLAELTKMDFDTVCVAMELLQKIGLIKILENGEIYITQLENLIGSVSKGALKKQQQRLLSGQKVDKCPPKIKIELKDKNKDKYYNNDKLNDIFEEFLQIRKKLKAVNSERAINMLINKLSNYDDEIKYKMIEQSIVNSWKDVYELKQQRKENIPNWFDKNTKNETPTEEEQEELDELVNMLSK